MKSIKSAARKLAACALAVVLAAALMPASALADVGKLASGGAPLTAQAAKKAALKAKNVKASDLKWTGKKLTVKVKVTYGKKSLKKGRDYTLSVRNAKGKAVSKPSAAGTYTAVVKGKGAYKGTVKKKFKVRKAAAAKASPAGGAGQAASAPDSPAPSEAAWEEQGDDGPKWVKKVFYEDVVVGTRQVMVHPDEPLDVIDMHDEGMISVWGNEGFWVSQAHPEVAYYPVKYAYDPWYLKYCDGKEVPVAVLTDEDDPEVHKVVLPELVQRVWADDLAAEAAEVSDMYPGDVLEMWWRAIHTDHQVGGTKESLVEHARLYGYPYFNDPGFEVPFEFTYDDQAEAIEAMYDDMVAIESGGHVCGDVYLDVYDGRHETVVPAVYREEDIVEKQPTIRWVLE